MQKLNPANKNLGIGLTLVEGSANFPLSLNTSVFSMMSDVSGSLDDVLDCVRSVHSY